MHISQSNLTQGNIWRHIINIASPVMIGYIFNTFYNWIDTFWGSKISTEALSSFSISFPVFLFVIAIGRGIASGGIVLISNALGYKNYKEAKKYLFHTVLSGFLAGLLLTSIVLLLSKSIVTLFGATGNTHMYSVQYLTILSLGFPFLLMFSALNAEFISRGNTKFMRNVFILNAVINFGLDPLLLYGCKIGNSTIIPEMGIGGIALATVFVHLLGFFLALKKIQHNPISRLNIYLFSKIEWYTIFKIIKYGLPLFLQIATAALGMAITNFFLMRISGYSSVAAFGIGLRIEQLVLVPTFGVSVALTSLVGQNNGAKNYLRIQESYNKSKFAALMLWLFCMIPVTIFSKYIAMLFTQDTEIIQITFIFMIFTCVSFMPSQLVALASGLLQGMKKPTALNYIILARQFLFPLLFIFLFVYTFDLDIYGVFGAFMLSYIISAIIIMVISNNTLRNKLMHIQNSII